MKKLKVFFTSIILLSCVSLLGCFNPVFYEIRHDVSPEPKTLNSPINMITRFTPKDNSNTFLTVISDWGIRYKREDSSQHDPWIVYPHIPVQLHKYDYNSSTHTGEQLIGIYASSDTLYLLTAAYSVNTTTGGTYPWLLTLWGNKSISCANNINWDKPSDDWEIIAQGKTFFPIYLGSDDYFHSAFSIFQTNTATKDNRKVFLRTGNSDTTIKYYILNKTEELNEQNPLTEETDYVFVGDSTTKCAYSAVYCNNKVLFFNGNAAITNEKTDTTAKFYYSNGYQLCYGYFDGDNIETKDSISMPASISSLAVCKDVLLIGCGNFTSSVSSSNYGGLYKVTLSEEGVPGSQVPFITNAQFQITSGYLVTCLLNATPDKSELESCLYCGSQILGSGTNSSVNVNNVGLWSYYPGRGNWNIE